MQLNIRQPLQKEKKQQKTGILVQSSVLAQAWKQNTLRCQIVCIGRVTSCRMFLSVSAAQLTVALVCCFRTLILTRRNPNPNPFPSASFFFFSFTSQRVIPLFYIESFAFLTNCSDSLYYFPISLEYGTRKVSSRANPHGKRPPPQASRQLHNIDC